jgi:hypothetical protein
VLRARGKGERHGGCDRGDRGKLREAAARDVGHLEHHRNGVRTRGKFAVDGSVFWINLRRW